MLAASGESVNQASGKLGERKRLQQACCLHLLKVKVKSLTRVWLFATLWTIARQAPPSMRFSSQEYWSEFPFSSPGDRPDPGIELSPPTLQADSLPSEPPGSPNILHFSPSNQRRAFQVVMWVIPSPY